MTELGRILLWPGLFHPELASRTCGRYCLGCDDPRHCKNDTVLKQLSKEIEIEIESEDDENDDA